MKERWAHRIFGLDPKRLIHEEPLRRSLLSNILTGSAILLLAHGVWLLQSGIVPGRFLWTTVEPALILCIAFWLNYKRKIRAASTWLLVGIGHAAAFTHAYYGIEHVTGALLALTIVACGLTVGAYFIWVWAVVCCGLVFFLAMQARPQAWTTACAWSAMYLMTGWLASLFSRHLERLIEANRTAEQRERNAIVAERTRFAREVHDTLAQGFTGVVMQLNAAEVRLDAESEARQHIDKARDLARESLKEARRSAQALKPGPLTSAGLLEALTRAGEGLVAGSPIRVHAQLEGTPRPIGEDAESELFRIGQEALTNAVRHAAASRIEIRLRYTMNDVLLEVRDNGCGMSSPGGGLGLENMKERAARIGGTLTIQTADGSGSSVLVAVPSA